MIAAGEDFPVSVHLRPDDVRKSLRADVRRGLERSPRELPAKWLYDEQGCALFDAITALPEYYPTRAERAILDNHADDIARISSAQTLIELGSGTSAKTRLLLDALRDRGSLERFVPFDVAEPTLRQSGAAILREYPGIAVEGVVGDFERHLGELPEGGRRLIAFLGGTIGNLDPEGRASMLTTLVAGMKSDDCLLIGTDLLKDRDQLLAAYDDNQGITAAFNRNMLVMINRELDATFEPSRFDHVARFDEENEWIEMRLRSVGSQVVEVRDLALTLTFEDGEDIRTEISTKFSPDRFASELGGVGLAVTGHWTDPRGDFALWLATR